MDWFLSLIKNEFIIVGLSSWFVAQILKVIIHSVINREFAFKRMIGDGGMPSGHSATVTSVATLSAIVYGTGSFEFAIAAIFALIVCHDAMGVRRETGKQAVILNELIKTVEVLFTDQIPEVKLKEFVGHTPVQVFAGGFLGIANAFFLHFVIFA